MNGEKTSIDDQSSDDSSDSEDEEEQQKIRAAVLGVGASLYQNSKSSDSPAHTTPSTKKIKVNFSGTPVEAAVDVSKLKSNRPVDKNDIVDENPLLQTTPEFRAYVAKQLSKLLDSDLAEHVKEKTWDRHIRINGKPKRGVRLFAGSRLLYGLREPEAKKTSSIRDAPSAKTRKIRLSSSSDSSEDEDIKACVYSVADIEQENLCLARLGKVDEEQVKDSKFVRANVAEQSESQVEETTLTNQKSDELFSNKGEKKMKNKKKKKKLKRSKEDDAVD